MYVFLYEGRGVKRGARVSRKMFRMNEWRHSKNRDRMRWAWARIVYLSPRKVTKHTRRAFLRRISHNSTAIAMTATLATLTTGATMATWQNPPDNHTEAQSSDIHSIHAYTHIYCCILWRLYILRGLLTTFVEEWERPLPVERYDKEGCASLGTCTTVGYLK